MDRFHVAKNYRECVDKVRKKECRRLKAELPEAAYEEIKGVMWIVRKNNRDLTADERKKLNLLFGYSPDLKLAYTFREELTSIFEQNLTVEDGKTRLLKWRDKARRSTLTCFNTFFITLDNWIDKIANYFSDRLTSGFVEGLNNKIKVLKVLSAVVMAFFGSLRFSNVFFLILKAIVSMLNQLLPDMGPPTQNPKEAKFDIQNK